MLLFLAREASQPCAEQHRGRSTCSRAVVSPSEFTLAQVKLPRNVATSLPDFFTVPSQRVQSTASTNQQTSQELNSSSHSSHCPGDELGHTATHEGSERHQKEQATAQAGHHGTDPPLRTGDALEGGIAPTLLHHHHHLPTLIMHRI